MRFIPVLLLALTGTSALWADTVFLVQGGRAEGELLNPDESPRETYALKLAGGGRLVLAAAQVERAVLQTEQLRRYEALLPAIPDTAAGHWEMAERCRQAGLDDERTFHLEQVIRHQPDHEQARLALGYNRVDGRWIRQDEWMEEHGYVRYRGGWRLPQEIALDQEIAAREAAEVDWRKKLKTWRSWVVKGRENRTEGQARIRSVRDPAAAAGLAEMLGDDKELRPLKLLYIEALGELGTISHATLIRHALNDPDAKIRDACLDQLERARSRLAVAAFIQALGHEQNVMVHRAAAALARLQDRSATLPLINALITEHKQVVGGGGGIRPVFSNQGGGLTAGGKPKIEKVKVKNEPVLHALSALNVGVNFGYNQQAWKDWYSTVRQPPPVDLRRGE